MKLSRDDADTTSHNDVKWTAAGSAIQISIAYGSYESSLCATHLFNWLDFVLKHFEVIIFETERVGKHFVHGLLLHAD